MKNLKFLFIIFGINFTTQLVAQSPQALPFAQNWSNVSLITADDIWTGVLGIQGRRGDGLTGSTGTDPQTILAADDPGIIDVIANQTMPNTNNTGGVGEFEITNPVLALQGSGTADAPYLLISINTLGKTNIQVSYLVRDIDGSVDNAIQPVALQYRIGNSGLFTNIVSAFVSDATTGPSLATLETAVSVVLPSACENNAEIQLRVITSNAASNDEWVGIDDISITGDLSTSCDILSVDFLNVDVCNDNGTPANSTDDYYVADVSVVFSNAPGTGFLQFEPGSDAIAGGGDLSVTTAGLTSPYTFTGVRFKADNTPTVIEIEFSAEPTTCVLTKVGPTVASCSAGVCNVSDVTLVNIGSCNNNGTPLNGSDDYFTADVLVNYSVKPNTGTLSLSGDNIGGVTSVNANLISSSTHTFTNVRFSADSGPITISASFSDVMGCSFTNNNAAIAPGPCTFIATCTFPFFSEYIEGSGNNKCLEIYNPTSIAVDLAAEGYNIEMYFNGNPVSTLTLNLTGTIQPGDVYVVCNSSATADFTSQADQIGTGGWFNGDDAVVLRNTSGITDVIGQIGVDPGTNWSNSGIETSEQTLRRYNLIQKGDNIGSDVYNPSLEWETYPQNTLWGMGYHSTECQPSLPYGWNPSSIGCNSGTSSYNGNTNTWTQTSNCFNPASGADDLTFVFKELCGDGEIVAQYMGVTPFGFAGLMMRENATASSKHVWLFNRANSNTSWSIRSTTGAAPLIQAKPHLNRTWMKLNRTGNVFRGYLSTNGITWQLLFQSAATMNDCLLIGIATHSNVDGNVVTSMFKNVNVVNDDYRPADNKRDNFALNTESRYSTSIGIDVYPNPVDGILNVRFHSIRDISEPTLAQIVDINGRLIMQQKIESVQEGEMSFDVSSLNSGIYLLKLSTGSKIEIIKVVKH